MRDLNTGEGLVVVPKTCQRHREPSKGAEDPSSTPIWPCTRRMGGERSFRGGLNPTELLQGPPPSDRTAANAARSRSDPFVFLPLTINPITLWMGK